MSPQELNVLTEIRERMVRVETKLDNMADLRQVAYDAHDSAKEALQSSKAAHHRLDEVSDNQRWLWRTVVASVIGMVVTILAKYKGGL